MAESAFNPTPADLDAMTRAVVGEAQSEPDEGQAGVAHVILNRLAAGNYGDSPTTVVMAGSNTPSPQFEPTGNRSSAFYTTSPQTPAYKHAAAIVQGVLSGDIPDPTGGATNFYAPVAQQAMGRAAPSWASGQQPTAIIGGHVFYAPNGPANGSSLLTPKPNNDGPDGNLGETGLPTLAYADGSPTPATPPQGAPPSAPSQGQPMPQSATTSPATNTADMSPAAVAAFAAKWGIPPELVSPPAAAAAPIAAGPPIAAESAAPGVSFAPSAAAPASADMSPAAVAAFAAKWGIDPSAFDAAPAAPSAPLPVPAGPSTPIGVNDTVRALATGVPILGGLANKADAAVNATLAPLMNRLFTPPDQLQGATWGDRYNNSLMQQQGMDASFAAQHPTANKALNIAGGVGGGAAAMLSAPAAFGVSDAPWLLRAAAGGATNAAVGGTDAYTRGQNPLPAAGISGALGAGVPALGAAAGGIARWVGNRLLPGVGGMGAPATRVLTNAFQADGPDAVQANLARLGPEAILSDAGHALMGTGQGVVGTPGPGASKLLNLLDARYANKDARLGADITSNLGPAEDSQAVTADLKAHKSDVDAANYGAVHSAGVPVDTSDVINLIDSHGATAAGNQASALNNLRGMLVHSTDPDGTINAYTNSEYLHNVRQEIDNLMSGRMPGLGMEQGSVARTGGSLAAVRGALDDALKTQVPGMAAADAQSAALASRIDAVQHGYENVFDGGATATSPTQYANQLMGMDPGTRIANAKGVRARIDNIVGTNSNDPAAMRRAMQGDGGWAQNKLGASFSPEAAQNVTDAVEREGTFANTRTDIAKGPQTAARLGAQKQLADADTPNINLMGTTGVGVAAQAGKSLIVNPLLRAISGANKGPMREQLGNALTLQGDPLNQLVAALQGAANRSGGVNDLARLAGQGITGGGNMLINPITRARTGGYQVLDGLPTGSPP